LADSGWTAGSSGGSAARRRQFTRTGRGKRVLTACALILSVSQAASAAESVVAPDFSLVAAEGRTVRLSEEARQQETTVLFFWATWCPYCKALMPHLQSMRLEYGDRVEILAINIKEDGEPVEFIESAGYDFTLLLDGDPVADAYRIVGTPGLIVVDRERVVRFDLRRLPPLAPPANAKVESHRGKAAYLAPYWASEIRKSMDEVLNKAT
jgi:thiol-disulfide isomerase/thioredoxin